MKTLVYKMQINVANSPIITEVILPYSEANENIAKREAVGGDYRIVDDGAPEVVKIGIEERVTALEKAVKPQEYVAGRWYYKGDRVSYNGAVYVCVAPDGVVCTWNPDEYPVYWRAVN